MKKMFFFALLFAGMALVANAQNALQDVVYLKNDSIIRDIIIEQIPNESIKIETRDRNVFVFKMDEISKFTKERPPEVMYDTPQISRQPEQLTKYAAFIKLGYGHGGGNGAYIGSYNINRLSLSAINGYKFSPYFMLGFETGFNYYTMTYVEKDYTSRVADFTIPLSLYVHANLTQSNVVPFFSVSGGYNVFISGDAFFAGLILEPTFGVSFKISSKIRLSLSLSYTMDQIQYYYYIPFLDNYGNITTVYSDTYKAYPSSINFKIGILNF